MYRIATISSFVFALTASSSFAGDVSKGESVFNKKCSSCHEVGIDAKNSAGPILNNIVGAQMAAVVDYKYSKSLKALGETGAVWSEEELDKWLVNQKKYIRAALDNKKAKSKMNLKVKKEDERADIIAYLASLSE